MGYAKRGKRSVNGHACSSVLKPVQEKRYLGLWIVGLMLLVLGSVAIWRFCCSDSGDTSSSTRSRLKDSGLERGLSEREIRLRNYAQHLKATGRCQDDNTARAAAEAMDAMRDLLK